MKVASLEAILHALNDAQVRSLLIEIEGFRDVETLIRMKESAGRPKDLEDLRQLRLLMEHSEDDE